MYAQPARRGSSAGITLYYSSESSTYFPNEEHPSFIGVALHRRVEASRAAISAEQYRIYRRLNLHSSEGWLKMKARKREVQP